ncbi:MAG: hypothetical protein JOZ70_15525 [Pseudolabrys sp.]|nr:hypothetical protein [Pseudolabrys sp.]
MSDISLSRGARTSVQELQKIAVQANLLQRQIATGKKVIDPSDNPAAFFTSATLKSRSTALAGLLDGIATAKSTIAAANKGISSLQSLITSAQSLANSALATSAPNVDIVGTLTLTGSSTIATNAGASNRLKAGDVVTVSDGTTTATYTAANNDTLQTFMNTVNGTSGLKITAQISSNNKLELVAQAGITVTIGATINGAGGATLASTIGLTAGATAPSGNASRTSYATQYNSLLSQINQLVSDSSYNGVNLLSGGSVSTKFNETGSSTYTSGGTTVSATSLGLTSVTGNFQTDTEINATLTALNNAASTLASLSGQFSAASTVIDARTDFTKSMISLLDDGADNLVAADVNEASAALLALQTRQQVAATALAMTTNTDNTALRLFGLA